MLLNSTQVNNAYLGSTDVSAIYLGETLIWPLSRAFWTNFNPNSCVTLGINSITSIPNGISWADGSFSQILAGNNRYNSCTELHDNLLAFYNFDGNALDVSENGKHLLGTYNAVAGKLGSAADFTTFGTCGSGPGLYYDLNLWDAYTGTADSNFTESFWYYHKQDIVGWSNTPGCYPAIFGSVFGYMGFSAGFKENATNILQYNISYSFSIDDPTPLVPGNWYHIVAVHDAVAKTLTIYKNGIQIASQSYTSLTRPPQNFNGFCVNGDSISTDGLGAQYGVPCRFDSVGLWNRVLTPAEILELYNGGSGLQYPFI